MLLAVLCHFHTGVLVPALFVEGLVVWAAVKDDFVAAYRLSYGSEELDDLLAETFALSVFVDNNVFDMAADSVASEELEFEKHGAACDDLVRVTVEEDDGIVCVGKGYDGVEALLPCGKTDVWCLCEVSQHSQMAAVVVVRS